MKLNKLAFLFMGIVSMSGCSGGGGGSSPAPQPLVSVAITPTNPSVPKGSVQQFTATGTFSNSTSQDLTASVTWVSSVAGVATISPAGLATSVGTGSTVITATSGNITSTPVTLTVTPAVLASIAVTPAKPTIASAATVQFTALGTFTDNTTQNLTVSAAWSSQATSVATISNTAGSNGLATGGSPGVSTIKALSGNISGSTVLTVTGGGVAANVVPITVNGSLCSSGSYPNKPCVSVTVCTPGTSTCQTINDILLDTGSYGLRVFSQILTVPLQQVTVGSANLANCVQFVDGSADWGPVQNADVILGGEPAVTVPIQVINAGFSTTPAACGIPEASPATAGFNGILGVGLFVEDCGSGCVNGANNGRYYACSGASCVGTTVALASQVQNPVAHLPVDNNGVLVQLPFVPLGGEPSVNGQLVIGINTQINNAPSGETVFPANLLAEFTTVYNGTTFTNSFIDTGSNGLFFNDATFPVCGDWYCLPATTNLSATTRGASGVPSAVVLFQIGNANNLFATGNRVFAELGGPLTGFFDWGLPFFYGRNVFVGINGKSAVGLGTGPFWGY